MRTFLNWSLKGVHLLYQQPCLVTDKLNNFWTSQLASVLSSFQFFNTHIKTLLDIQTRQKLTKNVNITSDGNIQTLQNGTP